MGSERIGRRVSVGRVAVIAVGAVAMCGFASTSAMAATSLSGKSVATVSCGPVIPWCAVFNPSQVNGLKKLGAKTSLVTFKSQANPTEQAQQLKQVLTQRPSAIVIEPLDQKGLLPSLTKAKQAKIPVVFVGPPIDPAIKKGNLAVTTITAPHTSVGQRSAQQMVKGFKAEGLTKGNILIISGSTADSSTAQRENGFRTEMKKYPQFKVVDRGYSLWDPTEAAKVTGPLLAKHSSEGINGIFGISGAVAVGAIKAAQQAGLSVGVAKKGVVVVGGNCNKVSMAALLDGTLYSDFTEFPGDEAKLVNQAVVDTLAGKKVKAELNPVSTILTKSNIASHKAQCNY